MSDDAVTPPLRIQPSSSKQISTHAAFARTSSFLADFQQRNSALSGGDATVPAQLFKLTEALREGYEGQQKTKS